MGTDEDIELELNGKHSKENLKKLLEVLTMHLKTVFLRNKQVLDAQLDNMTEIPDEHKVKVRTLFAEDMIKGQFPKKTLEVLSDYSRYFQQGLIKEGQTTTEIYNTF